MLTLPPPAPHLAFLVASLREDAPAPPAGWTRAVRGDGAAVYRLAAPPEGQEGNLVLFPAERATTPLRDWFEGRLRGLGSRTSEIKGGESFALAAAELGGGAALVGAVRPNGEGGKARVAVLAGNAAFLADKANQGTFSTLLEDIQAGRVTTVKVTPAKTAPKGDPALPASNPKTPLPPAALGGAKIYVATNQEFDGFNFATTHDLLVLFSDGSAFDALPFAVPAFTPGAIRKGLNPRDAGTWKADAKALTVTLGGKARVYRRVGEAWTADAGATDRSAYGVYRRVVPLTPAKLAGRWRSDESVTTSGFDMPMVTSGSSGRLTFAKGTYANAFTGYAGVSGAGVGGFSESKSAGDGRYRLDDGLLLTREIAGRRGVQLAFLIPFFDGTDPKTMWLAGRRWSRPEGG